MCLGYEEVKIASVTNNFALGTQLLSFPKLNVYFVDNWRSQSQLTIVFED